MNYYDELYQRVYAPIYEWDPEAEYHAQWVAQQKHYENQRKQSRVDAIETRKRECKRQ